jgi:hypothetical protein
MFITPVLLPKKGKISASAPAILKTYAKIFSQIVLVLPIEYRKD